MHKINTSKINTTRSFLALSAATLALMPLMGAVQAKPKDDAPAYGYRKKDKKDKQNKGRGRDYSRGDYSRGENFGNIVTLEAVVTSRGDSNDFQVRAGGRTFDVNSGVNVGVREGDRIVLRGSFDGADNFNAENVRVLNRNGRDGNGNYGNGGGYDNNDRDDNDRDEDDDRDDEYNNGGNYGNGGGYNNGGSYNGGLFRNGQRVSFPATFVRFVNVGTSEVRDNAGRIFRVETRSDFRLRRAGDRVQVVGTFRDNRIIDASLTSQNGGYGGGYGNGGNSSNLDRPVDFPARIVSLSSRDKSGVVRGDNGRTYSVRGSELNGFRAGDRVRVRGIVRNGVIDLRSVNKVR